ncbi:LysE family translocator [Vibrio ulleungensis]|uniref:LysE family translocator n=1 Tax=Vibrio ulleungensis TaxID=2807619 RepID=A0ABS2HPJ3_9VIBR|nr:LysE family translocator [Vibrio ulleungensis]MBM7038631.1 LysE family translocator [Vibrio ulleungensis]
MNEFTILATLATIHFIALMSPGPDFALVVQSTAKHGRKAGLAIATGLSAGILIHSTLSLTGVSYLVHNNPALYSAVQFLGGSYLLYLGLSSLKALLQTSTLDHTETVPDTQRPLSSANKPLTPFFRKGLMTNLLNPKALIFFVSLLSSIVPATMSLVGKVSAMALLWGLSIFWFSLLAYALSTKRVASKVEQAGPFIDGICALLFTAVGVSILWHLLPF